MSSPLRQVACTFLINSVSLLQGASVSTSSIILHELQNSSLAEQEDLCLTGNITDSVRSCLLFPKTELRPLMDFANFYVSEDESSWIGRGS